MCAICILLYFSYWVGIIRFCKISLVVNTLPYKMCAVSVLGSNLVFLRNVVYFSSATLV